MYCRNMYFSDATEIVIAVNKTDKIPALMEFTLGELYKDMIKNADISYTLANSEEGIITKILITESGPKNDLEKIRII